MRALTLTQPWATLVAIGAKRVETRSWPTGYRGPLAIHAAKSWPREAKELCWEFPFGDVLSLHGFVGPGLGSSSIALLPTAAIVAVVDMVACERFVDEDLAHATGVFTGGCRNNFSEAEHERDFGDWTPGRYGFQFLNPRRLAEPVPCRGALSLWELPPDVEVAVLAQLRAA